MRYRKHVDYDPAVEFTFSLANVPLDDAFADYARASFPPGATVLDGARDLMQRMHADFDYVPQSTQVNTPALEAPGAAQGGCARISPTSCWAACARWACRRAMSAATC